MDKEVAEIKAEHFEALKSREVILLVRSDYGFDVHHWTADSVAPTSSYDNSEEAGARALQLLNIATPVTPQAWPEKAIISLPDQVEEGSGCVWCDVGTARKAGYHETARGRFRCTRK